MEQDGQVNAAFLMLGMQYITTYIVMITAAVNPSWYDIYEELLKSIGFGDVTLLLVFRRNFDIINIIGV